jgi:hypothetical protein
MQNYSIQKEQISHDKLIIKDGAMEIVTNFD